MIHKIISSLFKPKASFQAAFKKHFFSEAKKQTQKQKPQQQQKPEPSPEEKHKNPLRDEDQQNEQEYVYQKQNRNTTGWRIYRLFFWGSSLTLVFNIYLVANHNKKTPVEEQLFAVPYIIDVAKWFHNQYHDKMRFLMDPPVKKFLPDSIHPAMQPKTLVLNFTGTLIKTDFVFGKGLTIKKRPGLMNFLKRLSQRYEVIIFSDEEYMFLSTAVESIDPMHQIFLNAFGKESMVWSDGRYIKDLTYLNRDPKNIIVIDRDIQNVSKHPQNVILLKEFDGDDNDQELNKLLPLLESLSDPGVRDIRKQLAKLGQNPHETYYEKLQQKKKNFEKKQSGMLGGFFGARPSQNQTPKSF